MNRIASGKLKLLLGITLIGFLFISLPPAGANSDKTIMADSFGTMGEYEVNTSEIISIPIYIHNVNNVSIKTISFDIAYDEDVILLESMELNELTEGWNKKIGTNKHSLLLYTSSNDNAISKGSSGLICNLKFRSAGNIGNSTVVCPENIDFASTAYERGIPSSSTNGTVTIVESTPANRIPLVLICDISPNPSTEGEAVSFTGSGVDSDGTIVAYKWTSSIDGKLNNSASFMTSDLSLGTHTISFSVQDDDWAWSDTVSTTLEVNEKANVAPNAKIISISPNPAVEGETVSFTGSGTDSDGVIVAYKWASSIDGQLNNSASFNTSDLSLGTHNIYFSVQDDEGTWSDTVSATLEVIDNQSPEVHISATPTTNVSINNPVTICIDSTDDHPAFTELVIQDLEGQRIINLDITEEVADGVTWEYVWNAASNTGTPVPSGIYWLFVNSSDTSDNTASTNVRVTVDNTDPTVSIEEITGSNAKDGTVYANSVLKVKATADGTPGNVNSLLFTFDSVLTSFRRTVDASFVNGEWVAEFNLTTVPDDGAYNVIATATDAALNKNSTSSEKIVKLDRKPPLLYPIASEFNASHGMVNLSSSEPLSVTPEIKVNSERIELSSTGSKFSGFFKFGDEDDFAIDVTGIDLSGNVGVGNSTMHIETIETVNNTASFISNESGTVIDFRTSNDTSSTISVTESDQPMANVTNGSLGVYYIDVNLGNELGDNFSNATIKIPVNESSLPEGVAVENVTIHYYNETNDEWEPVNTSVETMDCVDYWVATVDHFSLYAAMADDRKSPLLYNVTPEKGSEFGENTTAVNIRFNYYDASSGIDVSSITFEFNGSDINKSEALEITGSYTSYYATGLNAGDYTASVTVADEAGNNATFTTSFSIASGGSNENYNPPGNSGGSSSGSGGGGGGGSTGEAFENILAKDAQICKVAAGEISRYEFNEEKCNISHIQFRGVNNAGLISTLIETLKNTSTLVDESAPGKVYQNLNIWVGNAAFGDDKVEDAVIGFRISRNWMSNNGFEASDIALYRHSNGKWSKLPGFQTGEDGEFIYFEAKTPGFSPFAISATSGEKQPSPKPNSSSEEPVDEVMEEDVVEDKVEESSNTETNTTPGFDILLNIGILLMVVLCLIGKD